MIREERYLVLKWEDIYNYLSEEQVERLENLSSKIAIGRRIDKKEAEPSYVCVRDSWPEYNKVWKMIEDRIDNENTFHG